MVGVEESNTSESKLLKKNLRVHPEPFEQILMTKTDSQERQPRREVKMPVL